MKINWKLLITVTLLAFSVWALWPSLKFALMSDEKKEQSEKERDPVLGRTLKLGLDLKGGTYLLLETDTSHLNGAVKVKDAVSRAIEIIRNRIDQFGVTEPMIAKQGDKWIVIQLPGIKDPKVAKDLIGKTALLEFRIVNTSEEARQVLDLIYEKRITPVQYRENSSAYPDIKAVMPEGASVFESRSNMDYYVLDKALLTGAALANAKVEFGGEYGQMMVSIEFNRDGGKIFEYITERNIGKSLAIVLDGIVQSAPVIRTRISRGERASIEGNFNSEDAKVLAAVLRAGALPVPVRLIEERTVGPSLGDDSIKKGFMSSLIGIVLVFLFMFIYYRSSGLIADVALSLNLIILMAIMAYLKFTLTLPGVAGIALTLAMSVDANVLILERIREEIAVGKTAKMAVDAGYQKVFWTIFDANFTTLIAAVFLFQFGAGPIKGFAVTLSIGLIVSMFTAVTVTKLIYEFLFKKNLLLKIKI
ncbi:protein translocase subunit SecD [Candidatus Endomicrobiellum trichonymphae]|uniref:protein translocase subunit SecD n=1 Tax=Endomicrobium trichonymphae TaxID=1408204 RepID=UPI000865A8C9|nr:protein translocase subunit SecD [Candidatus Endomicrobium trichonymphae]BAV59119.1 protein translocase subunit SecD [Candidatus Endomicrobium trichonymphae]